MSYEPRAAFAGQIAEISVVELLQTILQGGHSGIARFDTPVGAATLWFRDGALVDADMGRHHMEGAVSRLLALESGTFEVEFKPITRRQVMTSTTAEMIASAPPRPGTPTAVPNDDNDTSRKRARRAGVSWHPTGGGRPNTDPSGAVPLVRPPTDSSGAVPIVAPPAVAVVARPAATIPAPPPTPVEADAGPRRTVLGIPTAATEAPRAEPSDEDRTLMRPGVPPPMVFVPPSQPTPATPLHIEARPAQWDAGSTPQVSDSTSNPTLTLPRSGATIPAAASAGATVPAPVHGTQLFVPMAPPVAPPSAPTVPAPAAQASVPAPAQGPAPLSTPIDSARVTSASGEFAPAVDRTVPAPAPGWTPAGLAARPAPGTSSDTIVVTPEVMASQTMTAGSIRRATPAATTRPGGARRSEERAAAVAGAIGMGAPTTERRAVSDGARLDQQVEAAGAAGLTGASAPAVVGRYEVLLRIARGGMGTVYLARVTGEGGFRRLFALKVVRDHLSQNDEYVRMLLHEARVASRLHHPNVVGIVDIGTLANQHYLVMDYVEGCTFSELLKVHRRTRPPHLIVPIVIDALMGLHAAHALVDDDGSPLTLVHCDFSPQNMLVGTNGICRITDFGIAKATNVINERPSITRGKPAYVSPEQVVGRALDHRSDIFSAGVVLWNALTGEQLFGGDTPEQTLHAVLQRPIPPPSSVGLRPPSCFDRVCLRALERDPAKRYQSAEQMLIELRRIAIAEDFLAPSSDVGRWVTDTFGRQLELRRQAAGIVKPLGVDSQPMSISVPELGFGDPELTSETRALPANYGQTPAQNHASETSLLRSDVVPTVGVPGPDPEAPAFGKAIIILASVAAATIAIAIAILRPDWIQFGENDAYGGPVAPPAAAATDGAVDPASGDDDAEPGKEAKGPERPETSVPEAKAPPAAPTAPPPTEPPVPEAKVDVPPEPTAKPKPKKPKKPKKPDAPAGDDAPPPPDPSEVLDGPPG